MEARREPLHHELVGADEILDVDVVAHARAVRRRVVRTKDDDLLAQAERRLQDHGDQVGLGLVVLSRATRPPLAPATLK